MTNKLREALQDIINAHKAWGSTAWGSMAENRALEQLSDRIDAAKALCAKLNAPLPPKADAKDWHTASPCLNELVESMQAARASPPQPEARCHWKDCPHGAECVHASPPEAAAVPVAWQPIETAPPPGTRTMFVVAAFGARAGTYNSDAYAVWRYADGVFARWPHLFPPTHWMPLAVPPHQAQGETTP